MKGSYPYAIGICREILVHLAADKDIKSRLSSAYSSATIINEYDSSPDISQELKEWKESYLSKEETDLNKLADRLVNICTEMIEYNSQNDTELMRKPISDAEQFIFSFEKDIKNETLYLHDNIFHPSLSNLCLKILFYQKVNKPFWLNVSFYSASHEYIKTALSFVNTDYPVPLYIIPEKSAENDELTVEYIKFNYEENKDPLSVNNGNVEFIIQALYLSDESRERKEADSSFDLG